MCQIKNYIQYHNYYFSYCKPPQTSLLLHHLCIYVYITVHSVPLDMTAWHCTSSTLRVYCNPRSWDICGMLRLRIRTPAARNQMTIIITAITYNIITGKIIFRLPLAYALIPSLNPIYYFADDRQVDILTSANITSM